MMNCKVLKIMLIVLCTLSFFSCNTDELENKIAELEAEKAEAAGQLDDKEGLIVEFIGDMNEIQTNLAAIKEREDLMTARFDKGNVEMNETMKDEIMGDIDMINNLLLENKKKMSSLNARLKKSNVKIAELEKMIENMAIQLQEKDAEIASLQTQLAEANQQLAVIFEEYNNRLEELGDQEDELNKAFYCYGSSKELDEQGVLTKEGGFIGIGKTQKLSDDFNKEYFTQVDIKLFSEISLNAKKAKLVTAHPSDSYKIEGKDGAAEKLVITNSEEFWASSKYLVIVIE